MNKILIGLVFILIWGSSSADVNEICEILIGESISKCKSITDTKEKLEYVKSNWVYNVRVDEMNDEKTYTLMKLSDDSGIDGNNRKYIGISCGNKKFELLVSWDDVFSIDTAVTYRIDKQEAVTKDWRVSAGKEVTFYPGDPKELLDGMISGDKLLLRTKPLMAGTVTIAFDTSKFKEAYEAIKKPCWL